MRVAIDPYGNLVDDNEDFNPGLDATGRFPVGSRYWVRANLDGMDKAVGDGEEWILIINPDPEPRAGLVPPAGFIIYRDHVNKVLDVEPFAGGAKLLETWDVIRSQFPTD